MDSLANLENRDGWIQQYRRASRCLRALKALLRDAATPLGLSTTEATILLFCHDFQRQSGEGIPQSQLVKSLSLSAAQVSNQLGRLQSRELVKGSRPPGNRRRQVWMLTEPGRTRIEKLDRSLFESTLCHAPDGNLHREHVDQGDIGRPAA